MKVVEPVSASSLGFFALRALASHVWHTKSRLALRLSAKQLTFASARTPRVNYGHLAPATGARPIGGEIKLIALRKQFPEAFTSANCFYLVSSALPDRVEEILRRGKRLGLKLVWNQNGVAYPGCYGNFYPWFNARMARLYRAADYVFYQSAFSRASALRYLGETKAPGEILLNPVNLEAFSPAPPPSFDTIQILAAGTSHALYRTQSALDTLRTLLARGRRAHLTIAGEFRWPSAVADVAKAMHGLAEHVTLLAPFEQSEAPALYRRAHLLLHTKFNDPCPTVPIEAMACGLPVVGTASGGMPELVPPTAGVLVPIENSWTRDIAGDPALLADAVEHTAANHAAMSAAARAHAERSFDEQAWLDRHSTVMNKLCGS